MQRPDAGGRNCAASSGSGGDFATPTTPTGRQSPVGRRLSGPGAALAPKKAALLCFASAAEPAAALLRWRRRRATVVHNGADIRMWLTNAENAEPNPEGSTASSSPTTPSSFLSPLRTSVGSANLLEELRQTAAPFGCPPCELPDGGPTATPSEPSVNGAPSRVEPEQSHLRARGSCSLLR